MKIKEKDPEALGELIVNDDGKGSIFLTGTISSLLTNDEISALAEELFSGVILTNISRLRPLSITLEEGTQRTTSPEMERQLDHVGILFYGPVPLEKIQPNQHYKKVNWETYRKIEACYSVLGVLPPIVLDRNYKIVDGDLRFMAAQEHGDPRILAIVLDDAGVRTDFLRLVLNRSSEFQRWEYPEVDEFVDNTPQAQPLLEPLGFFGENILPESFFGDTIIDYKIDEFNYQQNAYKQEIGLAQWAEIRRKQIQAEVTARDASSAKESQPTLFDF